MLINDKLEFSLDTLRFDTVFTERGSATRILKVYNPNDESVRISRIALERGEALVRAGKPRFARV